MFSQHFYQETHEKFAHQNVVNVRDILKKNGIKFQDDWNDYACPGYAYGK